MWHWTNITKKTDFSLKMEPHTAILNFSGVLKCFPYSCQNISHFVPKWDYLRNQLWIFREEPFFRQTNEKQVISCQKQFLTSKWANLLSSLLIWYYVGNHLKQPLVAKCSYLRNKFRIDGKDIFFFKKRDTGQILPKLFCSSKWIKYSYSMHFCCF